MSVIVRPWVKIFGVTIVVAAAVFGLWTFGKKDSPKKKESTSIFSSIFNSDKDYITVGTNTYAGFLPFMYLNNGLEPTEDCILYQDYGIKLKIVIQDDFTAGRAAFLNDEIDIIYCTIDSWPVETGEGSSMSEARFFNVSNFSRGSDAIVVNKSINKVSDLIGKVVACSEGTASHTLLLNTLETNGIGYDRVNTTSAVLPDKVNIKIVGSGLDAAQVFKSNAVQAAVVFSPDDQDIVTTMKGTKVLVSTKQASNIICDGLVAKQTYLDSNRDNVLKLLSALMFANYKMNTDSNAVKQSAQVFAKAYGTDAQFAIEGSKNIYYMTLEDQINFFGLNSNFTGIKGEELYSKMARTYEGLNLTKKPLSWRKVSDLSFIEYLADNRDLVKGDQKAENKVVFSKPTQEIKESEEISNKQVIIEFDTNSSNLDNEAKSIIDMEFVGIAKQFANSRIRVVGNTDNTGDYNQNINLSTQRAQSVVNYLVSEYDFDPNRFIIIGNGPKKAIQDNIIGSNRKYRSTEFQLLKQ